MKQIRSMRSRVPEEVTNLDEWRGNFCFFWPARIFDPARFFYDISDTFSDSLQRMAWRSCIMWRTCEINNLQSHHRTPGSSAIPIDIQPNNIRNSFYIYECGIFMVSINWRVYQLSQGTLVHAIVYIPFFLEQKKCVDFFLRSTLSFSSPSPHGVPRWSYP